ncbi:MAG: VOC family protein [Betaproteobacteria bacterium]|nr:VOC family protein [Betaproteobacteria bacterium]
MPNRQRPDPGKLYLDHTSHFVPDLGPVAVLLEKLGFVTTPLSVQMTQDGPAGSSNRCVMLAEGYLEFLMPTLDTPVARQMRDRMAKQVGVHLACFGAPVADEEHARLAAAGFEPLEVVRLAREAGHGISARFNVVRVPPEKMPEGRIQFVEHLTPDAIWRPEHLAHDNGVTGLAAVFVVADDPVAVAARYARFTGLLPRRDGETIRIDTDRGAIRIATRAHLQAELGATPAAPAIAGYALQCRDPAAFAARCTAAGLAVGPRGDRFCVQLPPSLGGAWMIQ